MSDSLHPINAPGNTVWQPTLPAEESAAVIFQESVNRQHELTAGDTEWLQAISGQVIDDEWLTRAHELVEVGSRHIKGSDASRKTTIVRARERFFEEMLDWGSAEHEHFPDYQKMKAGKSTLVPLMTTVSTLRLLYAHSLDLSTIIRGNVSILWKKDQSVEETILRIKQLGHDVAEVSNANPAALNVSPSHLDTIHRVLLERGRDPLRDVRASPRLLSYSEGSARLFRAPAGYGSLPLDAQERIISFYKSFLGVEETEAIERLGNVRSDIAKMSTSEMEGAVALLEDEGLRGKELIRTHPNLLLLGEARLRQRIRQVKGMCQVLQWAGDPGELMSYDHRLLASSSAKLMAHARIFQRYGHPELTVSQVVKFIRQPLEAHLVTLLRGDEYTLPNVIRAQKEAREKKDTDRSSRLLADRDKLVEKVGPRIVRAYEKYAASSGSRLVTLF